VNVADDAAVYFLRAFARGCCCGFLAEHVVEPCLLFLESLLRLVELVEASTLPFQVTPACGGSSLAEVSGEVGSPSAELSWELVEWTASGCRVSVPSCREAHSQPPRSSLRMLLRRLGVHLLWRREQLVRRRATSAPWGTRSRSRA
jgi:hypothetical protein